MEFKDYFENELISLRELGRNAALRNPGLAPFFDTPGRDPDIERLLESFAFLTGRLRQKLDDELPEITHGLFSRLWPNYLRPFPAASVIQYQPTGNTTGATVIPKGTLVESTPVDGTRCTFRTSYDTEVLPLRIAEQRFLERSGTTILAVRFSLTSGTLASLPLTRLRFFFTGKEPIPQSLYFTLLKRVKEVRFVLRDTQMSERVTAVLPADAITAVGFGKDEGLYPYPDNMGLGYRILQEYFCFPEKFLFADITGLEQGLHKDVLQSFQTLDSFELHFVLTERPKEYEFFHADNWKLFCTPVINLFPLAGPPLEIEQQRSEYRIIPCVAHPEHFSVYSVEQVRSWVEDGKSELEYIEQVSFESHFQVEPSPSYQLHIRPSLSRDAVETYISLHSSEAHSVTINLTLTCTNERLPEQLAVGDICLPSGKNDFSAVSFANIVPVAVNLPPPLEADLLWKLLSNMSLNYIPLTDVNSLRALLGTYHFRALHDHGAAKALEKNMRGIGSVVCSETDRMFKGRPVRGLQTRVSLKSECFSCEGALYLFSAVLNEFLALYATPDSFHQLTITGDPGTEYQWPARLGSLLQHT